MGKNKPKPFAAGKHVGGSTSATRLPSTGKKKRQPQAAASGGDGGGGGGDGGGSRGNGGNGGGGRRGKRPKSFLGLLAAGGAYVALWAWNLWSRGQQATDDRRTLAAMLAKPLAITEHAACRMDCRCAGAGGRGGLPVPRCTCVHLTRWLPLCAAASPPHHLPTPPPPPCSYIGRPEVEESLRVGRINARKSAPGLRPCPKYVVDATVGGGRGGGGERGGPKNVQAVFAACPRETRLITVIDKDTNWACGPC